MTEPTNEAAKELVWSIGVCLTAGDSDKALRIVSEALEKERDLAHNAAIASALKLIEISKNAHTADSVTCFAITCIEDDIRKLKREDVG